MLVNDEGDYKTKDKQRRTIKIRSQKEIKKKCVCPFLVWTLLFVQCKNDLFIYLSEQVAAHQKAEDRKGKYKYISQQVCWICWTCYVCHGVYISGVLMRLDPWKRAEMERVSSSMKRLLETSLQKEYSGELNESFCYFGVFYEQRIWPVIQRHLHNLIQQFKGIITLMARDGGAWEIKFVKIFHPSPKQCTEQPTSSLRLACSLFGLKHTYI